MLTMIHGYAAEHSRATFCSAMTTAGSEQETLNGEQGQVGKKIKWFGM